MGQANGTIEACAPGETALLIIDMINEMAFDSACAMLDQTIAIADRIQTLRAAAGRLGVPVVYVNDNFGQWHSERSKLVEHCAGTNGAPLVERLRPRDDDYFVIKPRHSGFYSTNLPVLLPNLGARRLILTGVAADICVLFTAADAHMREYRLWVPRDCVAAATDERSDWALDIMAKTMHAEIRATDELELKDWVDNRSSTTAHPMRRTDADSNPAS